MTFLRIYIIILFVFYFFLIFFPKKNVKNVKTRFVDTKKRPEKRQENVKKTSYTQPIYSAIK